jgi:small subunit ribosomal protein S6
MTQPYYETMYILRPDIPEEEVEGHITKYRDLVTEAGAEVLDCQMRGKRRLAYQIAKHREGIYVQLNHNGDGQQVATLERAMRLSEDVIRYLTVKQDGPMPAPRASPSASSETAAAPTEAAVQA